ncbi:exocyst complex component Sec5-domain-containing protein [Exophiala viscosa]|uniref:Exocyst complex component SEC5 n=1 Tax=Exophiala viscosa TaxID=2486360 RepID=A0AAN6DT70_9EURO|nr:exocyst complex component Sec5-domain-containing protein [Exophiala viscosa]
MGDQERTIITHYNLPTAFPKEWPKELDESDDDDLPDAVGVRRSRSRYSALERSASERKSLLPGSQQTRDGRANLVQKDEPDPLGAYPSVVTVLRNYNIPAEDARARNRFMLSSTTFSPGMFLSLTHREASTEDLLRGLEYLSRSIDQKSASLKSLVETNFERFVRAKATIDNVYTEMRNQGVNEPAAAPAAASPRHSRRTSGMHFRNVSSGSAAGLTTPAPPPPSKNALRKETDYGVQGIKAPLLEVSQKAEDVWGPALGGKEREANLKAIAEAIAKNRALYELGSNLSYAIRQKDYDRVLELYDAARQYVSEAKELSESVAQYGRTLSDDQVHRILAIGRMWHDAEEQAKSLKRDLWRRLSNVSAAMPLPGASQAEEHIELIRVLLHLGVEESPIWIFLLERYDYLKNKIAAVVERSKIEIEILRRRLAAGEASSSETVAAFLRQASKDRPDALDSEDVIDFWNCIVTYLTKLLSLSNGLLGEVVDFWESAQSFIDGSKQKTLPLGWEGESSKHHQLGESEANDLRKGLGELVARLRDAVFSLFADPPTDDISSLFSPLPDSAGTPATPLTAAAFSPTDGRIGRLDPQQLPAAAAKKGEAWEDFAFWPPRSNALSAVHYLEKILALVGAAASEMVALGPVNNNNAVYDKIKVMVSGARERCMRAVCESWNKDAESCKSLEDWIRTPEKRDQTRMPMYFEAYERKVLLGMQQVLYFSNTNTKPGSREIITPPSSKLLQMVRTQFVSSVYKAVSGMLENAETSTQGENNDWVIVTSLDSVAEGAAPSEMIMQDAINPSSRNTKMLLTMSNLKALRNEHVPSLIQLFESSFSVKLAEESKTIRDVFGQIDAKLFQSYTRPMVATLAKIIKDGINAPDWAPTTSRPDQVRPYVYAALMTLVMVHTEVSTTVSSAGGSSPLLSEVLSYLLENMSQALLDGFKERKPNTYTLPALMQATLDTEFIAQTMTHYATAKAGEIQGQIYTELDKRTTNEARTRLQQELGDMRIVLKKLREGSRNSFACFKRQRTSEKDRSGRPERKATGT